MAFSISWLRRSGWASARGSTRSSRWEKFRLAAATPDKLWTWLSTALAQEPQNIPETK
jgi:hypothetical protein